MFPFQTKWSFFVRSIDAGLCVLLDIGAELKTNKNDSYLLGIVRNRDLLGIDEKM